MGFSTVAVTQREKEAKSLKSFLIYSYIISLLLHIVILALGINKILQRVSETTDKPIEITIIETVPQQLGKVQEIQKSPPNISSGGSGGGGGNNAKISIPTETAISSVSKPFVNTIVKQPQPKTTHNFIFKQPATLTKLEPIKTLPITETTPVTKLSEKLDTLATTQPTPEQALIPNTKPSNVEAPKLTIPVSTNFNNNSRNSLSGNTRESGDNRLINSLKKGSGNGVGNGNGNGVGNGNGNGNGNGVGNGNGNGVGNEVENQPKKEEIPVATAPKPRPENGSKLNRADCIRCDIKYPDRARRRGVEGKAEVAIDTDANGNVTSVRLIISSGDSELDEAAQQAVQAWKLTPLDGGRQGVRALVNFAIKGSQRHRQIQERKREKQRSTAQEKPEKKADLVSPITAPPSPEPVKSDPNNQANESAAPSSNSSESN